jgi:hypothetical protein
MAKDKLAEEKLKLEIQELNKHWLKKPQYLQVLLPTTLAIFSLLYAITSGLFSSKQELLELNKKRLETDILSFQKEKETLILTNNNLKIQISKYNDSLQDRNLVLKKYENSFTKERQKIQALNDELAILKTTKSNYNTEIAALEKEYNDKKQVYLKEIESKYYKEIDNDKKTAELKETIKDLKENIVDLKYNINLFETNPYIMKDKQYYFTDWTLSKMIEYYKSKNDKSEVELQRLEKNREKIQKTIDTIQVRNKVKKIK